MNFTNVKQQIKLVNDVLLVESLPHLITNSIKIMSNQIIHNKKKLTVEVEIVIVKEDDYFVAYCPTLELSAYGDSEEYAIKSFREEVDIFLEEAQKQGTLEKYLLKNGWRLVQVPQPIYEPPHLNTTELFDVFKSGKSVIRQDLKFSV